MCNHTDATAFTSANFGQGTLPILLDDVACTVYESRLIDCPYSSQTSDCTHSLDAGVRCVARKLHSYTGHYYNDVIIALDDVLSILQGALMAASD